MAAARTRGQRAAGALPWLAAGAALVWASDHVRPVPAGMQVVMFGFGSQAVVQQSGLVAAAPWPFARLVWIPGPDAAQRVKAGSAATEGFLTGDGALIVLDAVLAWRVSGARAYAAQSDGVPPALDAAFQAAALEVAAGHRLEDFLPLRGAAAADHGEVQEAIAAAMNRRLHALDAAGAGLGIEILRVDATARMPQAARASFDAALTATRAAGAGLEAAGADAVLSRGRAQQARDGAIASAHAAAAERVAHARAATASILALAHGDARIRPAVLTQLYRERIAAVLARAGSVSSVDAKSVSHLILPGAQEGRRQ